MQKVRAVAGTLTLAAALGVLARGVLAVGEHDYVGAAVLLVTALALFGALAEILRPITGE